MKKIEIITKKKFVKNRNLKKWKVKILISLYKKEEKNFELFYFITERKCYLILLYENQKKIL